MTLKALKDFFNNTLKPNFSKEESSSLFFISISHLLNFSITDYIVNDNKIIQSKTVEEFKTIIERLKNEEPIQYIIGSTTFFDLEFKVDNSTLIPRPETEELVHWIIEKADKKSNMKILDIGTGSGCIAIALKKHIANATVDAIDFSDDALKIARYNASQNNVVINFIKKDILKTNKLDNTYDIIVSNPPYVRNIEKKLMKNNVLNFEPNTALFVSDDKPLVFYDKIAKLSQNHLTENGKLFFEINEYLSQEMLVLLNNYGFKNIILKKDIFSKPRMTLAEKDKILF